MASVFSAVSVFCLNADPLRLGSDVWPPFTDEEGNTRVAIDIVQTALERSGVDSTIVIEWDFNEVMENLKWGHLDGSAAMWKDEEREAYLLFSDPYLENRLVLVGRKGTDVSAKSLTELVGKRIAVVEGYSYGEDVARTGPVYVPGPSNNDNLLSLIEEKVDYVLVDELVAHHLTAYYPKHVQELLSLGEEPMVRRDLYFAIQKDYPGAEAIMGKFNKAVKEMLNDGTYHRILQVNWIEADADGDGMTEYLLAGNQAGREPPVRPYRVPAHSNDRDSVFGDKIRVEGVYYDDWSSVPVYYKVLPDYDPDQRGATVLELDF